MREEGYGVREKVLLYLVGFEEEGEISCAKVYNKTLSILSSWM